MTGKSDFTEEEWKTVLEGPTSAGMLVAMSSRGGTFRESLSMAKAYSEAREQQGESELLDAVVSAKPEVDRERPHNEGELYENTLGNVREALALLEQKATPEEIEDYKQFVLNLGQRVAEAHKGVGEKESQALDQIADTLGIERSA